jgi:hypothetical protein
MNRWVRNVMLFAVLVAAGIAGACAPGYYYDRPAYTHSLAGAGLGAVVGWNMAGRGHVERWRGAAIGAGVGALAGYALGRVAEGPYYYDPYYYGYAPYYYYPR